MSFSNPLKNPILTSADLQSPYGESDTYRAACSAIYHIISYPGAYTIVLLAMFDRIQPWYAENVSPSTPSANGALLSETTMYLCDPLAVRTRASCQLDSLIRVTSGDGCVLSARHSLSFSSSFFDGSSFSRCCIPPEFLGMEAVVMLGFSLSPLEINAAWLVSWSL